MQSPQTGSMEHTALQSDAAALGIATLVLVATKACCHDFLARHRRTSDPFEETFPSRDKHFAFCMSVLDGEPRMNLRCGPSLCVEWLD
jgi:hypothetical protein